MAIKGQDPHIKVEVELELDLIHIIQEVLQGGIIMEVGAVEVEVLLQKVEIL